MQTLQAETVLPYPTTARVSSLPTSSEIANAHRRNQTQEIAEGVAADLVGLRDQANVTLSDIAGTFGRQRAWMHKLETAEIKEVSLADYLLIVELLEGQGSDHPAIGLLRHLRERRRRHLRVVNSKK